MASFCRTPLPTGNEDTNHRIQSRIQHSDGSPQNIESIRSYFWFGHCNGKYRWRAERQKRKHQSCAASNRCLNFCKKLVRHERRRDREAEDC